MQEKKFEKRRKEYASVICAIITFGEIRFPGTNNRKEEIFEKIAKTFQILFLKSQPTEQRNSISYEQDKYKENHT